MVYLDDILVFSPDWETHLADLELVLSRLRDHGYYIKLSKCEFGKEEIDWVGHELRERGITVQKSKTKVIEEWKTPSNITELRAFLGMVNYYHKFIPNMALIAGPLNELLKKDVEWRWKEVEIESFNTLKKAITSAPILHIPDTTKMFMLHVGEP